MSDADKVRSARRDADAEAILSRRRFLIESAAVGAGLGALATGCSKEETRPELCLSVKTSPKPGTATSPQACLKIEPPPRPCLDVGPVRPQPCLSVAPPQEPKEGKGPLPQPCLAPQPPKPCLRIAPQPKICLSIQEAK